MNIRAVRGCQDILPDMTPLWQNLEAIWLQVMRSYGYSEIRMPIMEYSELFTRNIGGSTDIVSKEMFTFEDGDANSISLRPEGTASCVRAAIAGGLLHNQQQRLWYGGPMFRYERPQKGRYRQFNQFGVESFGFAGVDIEVEQLVMMQTLWQKLNIADVVRLEINNLGNSESRAKYREVLVEYFNKYFNDLDVDSKRRLETNPLRILDSKNPALKQIISSAPSSCDYLDTVSMQHWQDLQQELCDLNIEYTVNNNLVRGLDYYNLTVYEWTTNKLGAQSAVCAGGRYDNLVADLGGKASPGVGFALGVERLLLLCQQESSFALRSAADIYVIISPSIAHTKGMQLAENCRRRLQLNVVTNCGGGSIKAQFKRADKSGARLALVLAEQELQQNVVTVKFLREQQEQVAVARDNLYDFLEKYFENVE